MLQLVHIHMLKTISLVNKRSEPKTVGAEKYTNQSMKLIPLTPKDVGAFAAKNKSDNK